MCEAGEAYQGRGRWGNRGARSARRAWVEKVKQAVIVCVGRSSMRRKEDLNGKGQLGGGRAWRKGCTEDRSGTATAERTAQ